MNYDLMNGILDANRNRITLGCVVVPDINVLLGMTADFREVAVSEIPEGTVVLCGIKIYEKPGQRAQAWMFKNHEMAMAYLNGFLTEEYLEKNRLANRQT